MANDNPFKNMWNRVANWIKAPANHYLYVPIPKERTDAEYDEAPLAPYKSYFDGKEGRSILMWKKVK